MACNVARCRLGALAAPARAWASAGSLALVQHSRALTGRTAGCAEAHMEAATQDLEERHLMDEDMLDTPPLDRIEEAPARADDRMSDAPAAPEEPATEAVLPSDPPPNRPKALAKRRRRPA